MDKVELTFTIDYSSNYLKASYIYASQPIFGAYFFNIF